jgi:hypothetical protein
VNSSTPLQNSIDKTIAMVWAIEHMESQLKAMRRGLNSSECKNQMRSTLHSLGALSMCLQQQQHLLEGELRRSQRLPAPA